MDEDYVFDTIVRIPWLTISKGWVEGIELWLRDSHTFTLDIVLGCLLADPYWVDVDEQGFFMPRVGFIRWRRLCIRRDSRSNSSNNQADISEVVGRIMAIVSQLDEPIVVVG
jgi:hypothetical protein